MEVGESLAGGTKMTLDGIDKRYETCFLSLLYTCSPYDSMETYHAAS